MNLLFTSLVVVAATLLSVANCQPANAINGGPEENLSGARRLHRYISPDASFVRQGTGRQWFPSRITGIFDEDPAAMGIGGPAVVPEPIGYPLMRIPYGFKGRFLPNYFPGTRAGAALVRSENEGIGGSLGFGNLRGGVITRDQEKPRGRGGRGGLQKNGSGAKGSAKSGKGKQGGRSGNGGKQGNGGNGGQGKGGKLGGGNKGSRRLGAGK